MLLHDVLRDIPMEFLYRKIPPLTASPTYTDSSLLDIGQQREHPTTIGMLNWFNQQVRCDVTYSSSEPEQHRTTTTHSTINVDSQDQRQSQNDQNGRQSQNNRVITSEGTPVNWEPKNATKASAIRLTSTEAVMIAAAKNVIADAMWSLR